MVIRFLKNRMASHDEAAQQPSLGRLEFDPCFP
jgi:hypothetical protein